MKEMRNRGDNFLILYAALGKLGLLSRPSFNLVPAQNHPPRDLPAFAQCSSEFNSPQFPGLEFFFPCFSPRVLCMVFLPEKSTSFLPVSFWFLPFLSLHLLPLSHPLVPYAPLFLKIHHCQGGRKFPLPF